MPLGKNATAGDYVKDFRKSKAPQFKGKSKEKRHKMAIAAYLDKRDNQKEANHLIDEFGGKINKLENIDWAKKNSISNRPLIKIRDQILVSDNSNPTHLKDIKNKYPNKKIIAIPAALAFGTGDHATTSTCLRMVVDISKKYKKEKRNWKNGPRREWLPKC